MREKDDTSEGGKMGGVNKKPPLPSSMMKAHKKGHELRYEIQDLNMVPKNMDINKFNTDVQKQKLFELCKK